MISPVSRINLSHLFWFQFGCCTLWKITGSSRKVLIVLDRSSTARGGDIVVIFKDTGYRVLYGSQER